MTRALLAFALAFSLGSPAVQPWGEALLRLMQALPMAGAADNGSTQPPIGGAVPNSGAESDAGNHWDPNG